MQGARFLIIILMTACGFLAVYTQDTFQSREWENPKIFKINTEKPHATFIPYHDINGLIGQKPSPYFQSLNGKWKFNWVQKPADRPINFFSDDFDVSSWKEIDVPSNWEFQGYGDVYEDGPRDCQ